MSDALIEQAFQRSEAAHQEATDVARDAFLAGAQAVHREWIECHARGEAPPRGEPDFAEAASDYAATI